jgi:hypothetical protein
METYTKKEISTYVTGWLGNESRHTITEIKAMLKNALTCLECDQDGIQAMVNQKTYLEQDTSKYFEEYGEYVGCLLWEIARKGKMFHMGKHPNGRISGWWIDATRTPFEQFVKEL